MNKLVDGDQHIIAIEINTSDIVYPFDTNNPYTIKRFCLSQPKLQLETFTNNGEYSPVKYHNNIPYVELMRLRASTENVVLHDGMFII